MPVLPRFFFRNAHRDREIIADDGSELVDDMRNSNISSNPRRAPDAGHLELNFFHESYREKAGSQWISPNPSWFVSDPNVLVFVFSLI
jgi:hypothetical protein